jgi:hypothetical protein
MVYISAVVLVVAVAELAVAPVQHVLEHIARRDVLVARRIVLHCTRRVPLPRGLLALADAEQDPAARIVVGGGGSGGGGSGGSGSVQVVLPEAAYDALERVPHLHLERVLAEWLQRRSAGTSAPRRGRRNATGIACTTSLA